jgi:phosphoribosylanthranilate isomerase
MLVQIYETSSPEEANALAGLGVDHIGVLVGDGSFPRERTIDNARLIFSAIPPKSVGVALLLSSDVRFIEHALNLQLYTLARRPTCSNRRRYVTLRYDLARLS